MYSRTEEEGWNVDMQAKHESCGLICGVTKGEKLPATKGKSIRRTNSLYNSITKVESGSFTLILDKDQNNDSGITLVIHLAT